MMNSSKGTTSTLNNTKDVILFDGICNLCNGAVAFIIPRDVHGKFQFASGQSEAGQNLLMRHIESLKEIWKIQASKGSAQEKIGEQADQQLIELVVNKTIVLVKNYQNELNGDNPPEILIYSDAVLHIAKHLKFPWKLAGFGAIIPRKVRNVLYKWVSKNRYAWFGKKEQCMLPKKEWLKRFL